MNWRMLSLTLKAWISELCKKGFGARSIMPTITFCLQLLSPVWLLATTCCKRSWVAEFNAGLQDINVQQYCSFTSAVGSVSVGDIVKQCKHSFNAFWQSADPNFHSGQQSL
jgi:hypothetical protein